MGYVVGRPILAAAAFQAALGALKAHPRATLPALLGAAVASAAWATRGRSSTVFAPSIWRGPATGRALALTFDDGPSEATGEILELLDRLRIRATFFQCGANAERLPGEARAVSLAGHEIGNHTYSHARLWLRSGAFIENEIGRTQQVLSAVHGQPPRLFRAPYGVRWPGLRVSQRRHGLLGVMWTVLGRDWTASGESVSARLESGATPGAILCLHDGRELAARPDISATVNALRRSLPILLDAGYTFQTVSHLMK
jgi:peptidoglycan-N-acetylglucosamine deacetylase